ncbi:type III secretion system outer membrane ring subunit SctC [Enterobacter sp. 22466]|uniref:type III secretion system outer membrane ring subunit SctC n=1 Tax=Enterobacter sp. 22466 TaxID=3453924 RepID=UPI003F85DF37
MNKLSLKRACQILFLVCAIIVSAGQPALASTDNTYVASDSSVRQLYSVLSDELHKPVIVSDLAGKKRVTGNFDLNRPWAFLRDITGKTSSVWYYDGSAIYVYDVTELESRVVQLNRAPFSRLLAFLKSTSLYDEQYPPRANGDVGSFYISGPPVYVDLVVAAAKYMDATYGTPNTGKNEIRVIHLKNAFVTDRSYTQRDTPVTIPGVATVLKQLLNNSWQNGEQALPHATVTVDRDTRDALAVEGKQGPGYPALPPLNMNQAGQRHLSSPESGSDNNDISIVAYPDTNSLLVEGAASQVNYVQQLVDAIDIPKQQIQLSLWILDVAKDDVDELGIKWQGAGSTGNSGITFNTSSLTPQGSLHFLADISALAQEGNAQVVSHPELLTQENIPALFDNNTSFYARLTGERVASLEKITYGTQISVLPRLSSGSREIEMILNIQDGGLPLANGAQPSTVDQLPVVDNTQISTEARVPRNYSLLVGGYSRDQDEHGDIGIPLLKDIPFLGRLFDYHYSEHKQYIRMFLIQPKLLDNGSFFQGFDSKNPELGIDSRGREITLQATVSMLKSYLTD